jgi:hypothetical protein
LYAAAWYAPGTGSTREWCNKTATRPVDRPAVITGATSTREPHRERPLSILTARQTSGFSRPADNRNRGTTREHKRGSWTCRIENASAPRLGQELSSRVPARLPAQRGGALMQNQPSCILAYLHRHPANPQQDGCLAPVPAVSSMGPALLLLCVQPARSWLTVALARAPPAAPECSIGGAKGQPWPGRWA